MESSKPRVRYINWKEILDIIASLSKDIASKYDPDVLIFVAKGGLIPARILLDYLNISDIGFIEVKFYKGIASTAEKPFVKSMAIPPVTDKNVLIVDDVVDSGRTMQLIIGIVSSQRPRGIKTASLFVKPWSTYIPDFYYSMTRDWIIFPWEICESMREGVQVEDAEYTHYMSYCKA